MGLFEFSRFGAGPGRKEIPDRYAKLKTEVVEGAGGDAGLAGLPPSDLPDAVVGKFGNVPLAHT